jgi:adenine phosphoribosyltransferase
MSDTIDLDSVIRKIPDFPKPGILFYDITSVLLDPTAFAYCVQRMAAPYRESRIDIVAAVESRGFLFGPPVAQVLGVGVMLVRKAGKLPGEVYSKEYALEYGTDTIEVHKSDLSPEMRVLIIDDLVATGGTLKATAELLEEAGCVAAGVACAIGLPDLRYAEALSPLKVHTLIDYEGA